VVCCKEKNIYQHGYGICRSLLLEKSNEIIRLKQDNEKYKQRVEKYAQEIRDKDKEITGRCIHKYCTKLDLCVYITKSVADEVCDIMNVLITLCIYL